MTDYRRGDERIMRCTEVNCGRSTWVRESYLVRCRDCANLAVAAGGARYCAHWSRKVPMDGYCHLGERSEEEDER